MATPEHHHGFTRRGKKDIWAPHEQWPLLFALVSNDVAVHLHSLFLTTRVKLHKTGEPVWHLWAAERGRSRSLSFHLSSFTACSCSSAVLLSCTSSGSTWMRRGKNKYQCGLGATSCVKISWFCSGEDFWVKTCFFSS